MEIERIYYKHYRYLDREQNEALKYMDILRPYTRGKTEWQPTARGGATKCYLVLDNGEEIVGIANCSRKDNFNYNIGREIARGRAEKEYKKTIGTNDSFTYTTYIENKTNLNHIMNW